jgi:replication initiator protein RepSA
MTAAALDLGAGDQLAGTAEATRFLRQAARAGFCAHPVRLEGGITHARVNRRTGELVASREVYSSDQEPGGLLLKACGNRRASRCSACAEVYRRDEYQLVRAGLAGGKGVPTTVAEHPRLFVTLTAPGFGPVHTQRVRNGKRRPCRPRHPAKRCAHGRPAGCHRRHPDNDPQLGQPICPACFDYQAAVLWNAVAPELWRRTSDYTKRYLARLAGLTLSQLKGTVRVSFTKVAEYQHRGLVHFHAVVRLDAAPPAHDPDAILPPLPGFTTGLLATAIELAAHGGTIDGHPVPAVTAPLLAVAGQPERRAVWGKELQVRPIRQPGPGATTAEQVAGYVAKYATKGTESFGPALDRRIRSSRQLARAERGLTPHIAAMLQTCWALGADPALGRLRLRAWAHMLGFGGHWTTKSRRYSTTMGALRRARATWTARHHGQDVLGVDHDQDGDEAVVVLREWAYRGAGWQTPAQAALAVAIAAYAREQRRTARAARATA